jgi:hypothetical protein
MHLLENSLKIFLISFWINMDSYIMDLKLLLPPSPPNNNNQAFYSQASWGRLVMKPHEPKKYTKQERKRR